MSKERLEEIKNGTYLYFRKHNELKEDMDWLIEQAERVQELEEAIADYAYEIGKRKRALNKKNEQNKRYREALEEITSSPLGGSYTDVAEVDRYQRIARKALEGEC